MARVQPGNSLVFRGFHQREKRTSKDERRRVMTEEISGCPGKTNRQTTRKILKYTYRKESKKLENYRDVRPWSTLKLANFPIFFSASSSPGSLDLSIPFRELWVVREMRPTCAIKNTKEGEELQRYEILLRAVQDFSRDTLAKTGERNSVRFYAFPATGVIGTRGVKGSDHDHPLLHFSLRIFLFFFFVELKS